MGLFNRISSVVSRGWNKARNGIGQAVNNVKSGVGNAFNKAKQGLKKGWEATKDFADKHADTIGKVAAGALSMYSPALGAGAGLIASHFANDKTGWGRFAKSLAGGVFGDSDNMTSKLDSQSKPSNTSNGHIATGYSISATGANPSPIKFNGQGRKVSRFLG